MKLRLMFIVFSLIAWVLEGNLIANRSSFLNVTKWRETSTNNAANICKNPNPMATIMFLHIFKAAGSTTRDTLKGFSRQCNLSYKSCGSVCGRTTSKSICLHDGQVKTKSEIQAVRETNVIAGHLWFGMHRFVQNSAVYITCLRRPLETAISGKLYLKSSLIRGMSDEDAADAVQKWLASGKRSTNYVKRLTGAEPKGPKEFDLAAVRAIANLQKMFAVVGVVELYGVFIDLVQHLIDPLFIIGRTWWETQKSKRENSSAKSTSTILRIMQEKDTQFVLNFNSTLLHDWKIYEMGLSICLNDSHRLGIPTNQSFH